MEGIGKGLGEAMIFMCVVVLVVFWGGYKLIDYYFIDETIETTKPITPDIKITVKDNVIDTLYIYREPNQ